mmetsp:Transcript_26513/g.73208  ORF Transcript_26513/g.73208 Transcript_26513/m.73208 type:complete len:144 (-) Transcript_26513:64-495(-)
MEHTHTHGNVLFWNYSPIHVIGANLRPKRCGADCLYLCVARIFGSQHAVLKKYTLLACQSANATTKCQLDETVVSPRFRALDWKYSFKAAILDLSSPPSAQGSTRMQLLAGDESNTCGKRKVHNTLFCFAFLGSRSGWAKKSC